MVTILYIGRFQPFHNGHLSVIRWLQESGYDIIIGIGSSEKKNTESNPWSFDSRRKMIEGSFSGKIIPIPDIPSDLDWVDHVERCVGQSFQGVCTGNKIVAQLFEWGGYNVLTPPFYTVDGTIVTGTAIRSMIRRGEHWEMYVPSSTVAAIAPLPSPKQSPLSRLKMFFFSCRGK
jgi:nicotinamide-nucleotide adenylyltransferase